MLGLLNNQNYCTPRNEGMAMEKEYLWIEYEKKNIFGKLTKYELRLEKNKLCCELNELLMNEFGLNHTQFKNLISEGFLQFEYEDLIERYHDDLLEMFEWEIEEDHKEQLEDEKWYHGLKDEDEEEIYCEFKERQKHGVYEHMFH